jgi:hypothetical protein
VKPLITSVSPSGQRTSPTQPNPGFFRATKTGRSSDIFRIRAYGALPDQVWNSGALSIAFGVDAPLFFEFDKGPMNKFPFQPYLPSGSQ